MSIVTNDASPDDADNVIKNRLKEIFPHPETAAAMVDLVVNKKRPHGWSRKSCATYYKEIYATQIRDSINSMMESKKRLVYRYDVWCNEAKGDMSPSTLYFRINQSIRYLIEQMDTEDHMYRKWYEKVRITREKGVGVYIEYIPGLESDDGFAPEMVEPKAMGKVWEREMDEWLESDDATPFVKENLALSPDEIIALKVRLAQLSSIAANITSSSVKIIRLK